MPRELAESIVTVANGAGLPTAALLTDMNEALGRTAGNALEVRECDRLPDRRAAATRASTRSRSRSAPRLLVLGRLAPDTATARRRFDDAIASGAAAERFGRMVASLGGPADLLENPGRVPRPRAGAAEVHATSSGFVTAIDTRALGVAIVALGGGRTRVQDPIDPAVGLSESPASAHPSASATAPSPSSTPGARTPPKRRPMRSAPPSPWAISAPHQPPPSPADLLLRPDDPDRRLPKAELHVHLEGTATPELVRSLASRHRMALPPDLFDAQGDFAWDDFLHFLKVYDDAAAVIRTDQDYRDVTYDYLRRCAAEGAIYVEVMSSPDHAAQAGLSFQGHLDGIVQGIEDAQADFGIEARLIVTCVRHFGVERGLEVAKACTRHRHPLMTGFGMGGDENHLPSSAFAKSSPSPTRRRPRLHRPCRRGRRPGQRPRRARQPARPPIGHGVRAIEDPALTSRIADEGIVLEVCPTSNIRTAVYPDYAGSPAQPPPRRRLRRHPQQRRPALFATSIGHEYDVAKQHFGWSDSDLASATATSLDAAFIDAETRARLEARIKSAGTPRNAPQ